MYLNLHHGLRSLTPPSLLFQSASHHRLGKSVSRMSGKAIDGSFVGQTRPATLAIELVNSVHLKHCPKGELVRATCRLADITARSGNFKGALAQLGDQASAVKGLLKQEQRLKAFATAISLRRSIHR